MFLKSQPTLLLASTSAYRRALLERLGLPFGTQSPGIDETPLPGESVRALVARLALAKARAIASNEPDAWVIGSDQAAVRDGAPDTILGKPGSVERCIAQLEASSGRIVEFLTAVALVRQADGATYQFMDTTRVRFRTLGRDTIERYVKLESPLD